jgi:Uma2 family endonuclease
MSTQPRPFLTPEQYLEIEREAEFRSEYDQGEMFAMSGAQEAPIVIAGNAMGQFYQQFRRRQCKAYSHDMRVWVAPGCLYTYPV